MHQINIGTCFAAILFGFACLWPCNASAMAAYVVDDQLILSGQVVDGDAERVAQALASSAITTVILRNSPGGDSETGGKIAEMLRQRGLRTAVSGFCYSVCGRIFLGGRTRYFTDDFAPEFTNVGFHGYYHGTVLDPVSVQRLDLHDWYLRYSDGKGDPKLIDRWLALPTSAGVIHFYNAAQVQRGGASTFLCQGSEPYVDKCEYIAETALDVGVVTSLRLIHSADVARMARLRLAAGR
jgi:hypothetical protein